MSPRGSVFKMQDYELVTVISWFSLQNSRLRLARGLFRPSSGKITSTMRAAAEVHV